jgi:hypothetical protein
MSSHSSANVQALKRYSRTKKFVDSMGSLLTTVESLADFPFLFVTINWLFFAFGMDV